MLENKVINNQDNQDESGSNLERVQLRLDLDKLQSEYERLKSEYEILKLEYSENHIIQSMNDMKERYERLVSTSVPNHKYQLILEKFSKLCKHTTSSIVLLDHIGKNIRSIEKLSFIHEIKNLLAKVDLQLTTTKDILQEGVDF